MSISFRRIIYTFTLNLTLFLMLILGIQNSSDYRKVNLLFNESANLPLSFIIGISFISGSLLGSLLELNPKKK